MRCNRFMLMLSFLASNSIRRRFWRALKNNNDDDDNTGKYKAIDGKLYMHQCSQQQLYSSVQCVNVPHSDTKCKRNCTHKMRTRREQQQQHTKTDDKTNPEQYRNRHACSELEIHVVGRMSRNSTYIRQHHKSCTSSSTTFGSLFFAFRSIWCSSVLFCVVFGFRGDYKTTFKI